MNDLTTLSTLLGSQEVRDAAPCVEPVEHLYVLSRAGTIRPGIDAVYRFNLQRSGKCVNSMHGEAGDCIWSGDLPALLAALVAEQDRLRELVEAAYREGLHDGYHVVEVPRDEDWERSKARATLKALKEQQP